MRNGEEVRHVLSLIHRWEQSIPDIPSLCGVLRECQRLQFPAGVHMSLKLVGKAFAHSTEKADLLQAVFAEFPELAIDLAVVLVSERAEDVRTVLAVFSAAVGACEPRDLQRTVLLTRMHERFPELSSDFFRSALAPTEVDPAVLPKVLDLQYQLAKRRNLLSSRSHSAITMRFADPATAQPCDLLLDLISLARIQSFEPQLFAPTAVSSLFRCLSSNDEYLVDGARLLIALGKDSLIFELEPYCVFYNFCDTLVWSLDTFFDVLIDSEAELLELMVEFAREAAISWRKWAEYRYIWHLYEQRKTCVNSFLAPLCSQLKSRRSLLHFNPRALTLQLRRLLSL